MKFLKIKLSKIFLFLLTGFLLPLKPYCQEKINPVNSSDAGLERVSAYGRLWGVVSYFHPEMGKGSLNGDSLFLNHLGHLPTDASAINFKQSIIGMVSALHDSKSIIYQFSEQKTKIKAQVRNSYSRHLLSAKQVYIALPQTAFSKKFSIDSVLIKSPYKNVIVDLRNAELNNDLGLKQYKLFVQPLIASMIKETMILPIERSFL